MHRVIAAALCALALAASPVGTSGLASPPPVVVAVVGEAGLNPAHLEFAQGDGRLPTLPPHQVVTLPALDPDVPFEEFVEAMAAGPLGRLVPGKLYRVAGTRLLIHVPSGLDGPYNVVDGPDLAGEPYRRHGTGSTASAIGAVNGSAPDAWAVFVPTSDPTGYAWLAEQDWIDLATVSAYEITTLDNKVLPCPSAEHVRTFTEDRIFFASAGNSDHTSLYALNALPDFYLVGGVDDDGVPVTAAPPDSLEEDDVKWALLRYTTRPYETGDRYEFQVADSASLDGTERFGGTSGAAPTSAGRAALLVARARALLGDDGRRPATVLAKLGPDATAPASGPLADGDLTAAELTDVLHAVARPYLATPGRYAVEGYGALDDAAVGRAVAVLRGTSPLPARTADDADHQRAETVRAAAFDARDCG